MLTETQRSHLEEVVYPRALAATGLPDTANRRIIAASNYFQFLALGESSDAEAAKKIADELQADAAVAQGD